jgi:hypothetical protein
MSASTTIINLNGRKFLNKKSVETNEQCDGSFEKKSNGVLLRDTKGEVIAFIANGLRRKESPFLVTARLVEKSGAIRYMYSLCGLMERFFNIIPEGEYYSDRKLEKTLDNDTSAAVEALYGKVFSGIAL